MPHHMQSAAERFSSSKRLASVLFKLKQRGSNRENIQCVTSLNLDAITFSTFAIMNNE